MVGINKYYVIETPCFPRKYKVVNDFYKQDNATCNYFKDEWEAELEAEKRNNKNIS